MSTICTIKLNDHDLNGLVPRYKKIQTGLSDLSYEINNVINRLEPALATSMDIDLRLCSILRNLQNCEEKAGTLISQITMAVEQFDASERRVVGMSNELIYQFKQIVHQTKGGSFIPVIIDPSVSESKQIIEDLFAAQGHIESVKLGYIADITGIRKDEKDDNGSS